MKITVLGGGHGCYAAAAEMAEKGHEVMLWRRDREALQQLAATGELKIKDYQGDRSVTADFERSQINLTDDLQHAIQHAELIIIPLPATTHLDLAQQAAPFFQAVLPASRMALAKIKLPKVAGGKYTTWPA